MTDHIATAIAALAASIADALLDGRPTAALRAEMSELEQRQRREAAAAAEREARAAAEADEQARQQAAAAALVLAAETRLRGRLSALEPPPAPLIRRTPQGIHFIAEVNDE